MNVLEEANAAVGGDRGKDYGHPADDFKRVTDSAKALGIDPLSGPLHHSLYMVLVKLSRLVQTPTHHDSIVDIAGYARTYEMVLEKNENLPSGAIIEVDDIHDIDIHGLKAIGYENIGENRWRLKKR